VTTLYDYGPALIDLRFTRGDDFSMVVDVEGDRDADAFAASLRPKRSSTVVAFTTSVGAYDSGTDTTPITITMADTTTDDLVPGLYVWDLEWTASGGAVRTIAGGDAVVREDVTA
jgi:hypothetical protein